jgi:hypothetical protein
LGSPKRDPQRYMTKVLLRLSTNGRPKFPLGTFPSDQGYSNNHPPTNLSLMDPTVHNSSWSFPIEVPQHPTLKHLDGNTLRSMVEICPPSDPTINDWVWPSKGSSPIGAHSWCFDVSGTNISRMFCLPHQCPHHFDCPVVSLCQHDVTFSFYLSQERPPMIYAWGLTFLFPYRWSAFILGVSLIEVPLFHFKSLFEWPTSNQRILTH